MASPTGGRQRERGRMAGLAFRDGQTLPLPVDVVQCRERRSHVRAARRSPTQQHRVVPFASPGAPVDAGQDRPTSSHEIDGERRESIHLRPPDSALRSLARTLHGPRSGGTPATPRRVPHRGPGQPGSRAFHHERGHQRRGRLRRLRVDPLQVGLEPVEMMTILIDRRWPQAPLARLLDEAGHLVGERHRIASPASPTNPAITTERICSTGPRTSLDITAPTHWAGGRPPAPRRRPSTHRESSTAAAPCGRANSPNASRSGPGATPTEP